VNRKLAPTLKSAGVHTWVRGEEKASDHAPTWMELDVTTAPAAKAARKR
jgi:exodeoxyribonuclease III